MYMLWREKKSWAGPATAHHHCGRGSGFKIRYILCMKQQAEANHSHTLSSCCHSASILRIFTATCIMTAPSHHARIELIIRTPSSALRALCSVLCAHTPCLIVRLSSCAALSTALRGRHGSSHVRRGVFAAQPSSTNMINITITINSWGECWCCMYVTNELIHQRTE